MKNGVCTDHSRASPHQHSDLEAIWSLPTPESFSRSHLGHGEEISGHPRSSVTAAARLTLSQECRNTWKSSPDSDVLKWIFFGGGGGWEGHFWWASGHQNLQASTTASWSLKKKKKKVAAACHCVQLLHGRECSIQGIVTMCLMGWLLRAAAKNFPGLLDEHMKESQQIWETLCLPQRVTSQSRSAVRLPPPLPPPFSPSFSPSFLPSFVL